MPVKGKGKISKQTNKLESIDSIAAAFNIGLLAAEPFSTCRVLMNSKQRKSKQRKNWGVYLVHLIYCFYWKEKLRLTWRHSSVQCQIYCRSNSRPDCLPLTLRALCGQRAELLKVRTECPVSITNNPPAGWGPPVTNPVGSSVSSSRVAKGKHRSLEWCDENEKKKVIGDLGSSGIERKHGIPHVEWERVAKATVIWDLDAVLLKGSVKAAMWISEPKSMFSLLLCN